VGDTGTRINPDAEHWNIAALDTAVKINTLTALEKDVILETNKARSDPRKYAQMYIKPMIGNYKDKLYRRENGTFFQSTEGAAAAEECFKAMSDDGAARPLLTPLKGLYLAARDHALDQGATGQFMHIGGDGSTSKDRVLRHCDSNAPQIGWAENISYGPARARDIVCFLLIDDGVPDRGHRDIIMEPHFTQTGAFFGPHPVAKWMCVVTYGTGLKTKPPA